MLLPDPTFPFPSDQAEAIRAQSYTAVTALGAPPALAHQVADMAVHITQETLRRCEEVSSTIADGRVVISASTMAFSLLQQRFAFLMVASKEIAEENGWGTSQVDITLRA